MPLLAWAGGATSVFGCEAGVAGGGKIKNAENSRRFIVGRVMSRPQALRPSPRGAVFAIFDGDAHFF